ncbi:MAG: TatD family deoxyribonuclease, partial [Moraxellaceae bacterium]
MRLMNPVSETFIDTHTHFDFEQFDRDRVEVWARCNALGVNTAIIPGVSAEQWPKAAAISEAHAGIFHSVGLHPYKLAEFCPTQSFSVSQGELLYDRLMQAAKTDKCVAIGECGLDQSVDIPLVLQQRIFETHLAVANELSLPLIVHARKTHSEIIACLKAQLRLSGLSAGGVIHAFSGSAELAME